MIRKTRPVGIALIIVGLALALAGGELLGQFMEYIESRRADHNHLIAVLHDLGGDVAAKYGFAAISVAIVGLGAILFARGRALVQSAKGDGVETAQRRAPQGPAAIVERLRRLD